MAAVDEVDRLSGSFASTGIIDLAPPADPDQLEQRPRLGWAFVGVDHRARESRVEIVTTLVLTELPDGIRQVVREQVDAALLPIDEPHDSATADEHVAAVEVAVDRAARSLPVDRPSTGALSAVPTRSRAVHATEELDRAEGMWLVPPTRRRAVHVRPHRDDAAAELDERRPASPMNRFHDLRDARRKEREQLVLPRHRLRRRSLDAHDEAFAGSPELVLVATSERRETRSTDCVRFAEYVRKRR